MLVSRRPHLAPRESSRLALLKEGTSNISDGCPGKRIRGAQLLPRHHHMCDDILTPRLRFLLGKRKEEKEGIRDCLGIEILIEAFSLLIISTQRDIGSKLESPGIGKIRFSITA